MGQQSICGSEPNFTPQLVFEGRDKQDNDFEKPVKIQAKKNHMEETPKIEQDLKQQNKTGQNKKTSPSPAKRVKSKMFLSGKQKKSYFYEEQKMYRENRPALQWNQFKIKKKNRSFQETYLIGNKRDTYEKNAKFWKVFLKTGNIQREAKIYNKKQMTQEEQVSVLDQIELIKSLDHPNILRLLESFAEDQIILVYEKFDGISLKEILSKKEKMMEAEIMSIMIQLFRVIFYLHCQGISHENIRPQNLYIDQKNNFLKLTGFNQAATLDIFSGTSSVFELNQCNDIWGAGWIMFLLMFGIPNFNQESIYKTAERLNQELWFLNKKKKNYSSESINLLQKLLRKKSKYCFSIKKALEDPWFENFFIQKKLRFEQKKVCLRKLRDFQRKNPVQVFIRTYILTQLASNVERFQFLSLFNEINANKKGVINYEQFRYALTGSLKRTQQEQNLWDIFQTLDTNKSNTLEFTEFIVGVTNIDQKNRKKYLQIIFNSLDEQQYGQIDFQTLQKYLKGNKRIFKKLFFQLTGEMGVLTRDKFLEIFSDI